MATRLEAPGARSAVTLDMTIRLLQEQGALSAAQAQQVKKSVNLDDDRHPFVQLADLGLRATGGNREPLTLENITRLVASASNMDYFRIDPLKINVEAITALVSQAYATRFQFLPVLVNDIPDQVHVVERTGAGLCRPMQVDAFVDGVLALHGDFSRHAMRAQAARSWLLRERGYDVLADRVVAVLNDAMNCRER